jgi:hypothetical protein
VKNVELPHVRQIFAHKARPEVYIYIYNLMEKGGKYKMVSYAKYKNFKEEKEEKYGRKGEYICK